MTELAHNTPARTARQIHRSQCWLFLALWLLVTFHGVVLRRHELWPHGALAISIGIVPPLFPFVVTWWGQVVVAMYCWLVTTFMVCGWVAAARRPRDGALLFIARATMCLYWLSLSFLIAFET